MLALAQICKVHLFPAKLVLHSFCVQCRCVPALKKACYSLQFCCMYQNFACRNSVSPDSLASVLTHSCLFGKQLQCRSDTVGCKAFCRAQWETQTFLPTAHWILVTCVFVIHIHMILCVWTSPMLPHRSVNVGICSAVILWPVLIFLRTEGQPSGETCLCKITETILEGRMHALVI